MTWTLSPAAATAQLQATMTFADTGAPGSGAARLQLFASTQPAPGAAPASTPQAEIVLATPCGTITAGVWSLTPADSAGALVLTTGIPRWARWLAANGDWVADGTVTDAAGTGDIRIGGGQTPEGETGPLLLAGGLALLGASALT